MKKRLAILLVTVFALTCALTALSASAASYTDLISLLPANEGDIRVNGGVPLYSLSDGKLSLTRDGENDIAWPSIAYDMNVNLDLSVTPYLHMSFETSGEGDRGVNGFINLQDSAGNQVGLQLSAMGGNDWDDFRDTGDMYIRIDLGKFIQEHIEIMRRNDSTYDVTFDTTGKITITSVSLSVYGGMGETIVWNALALAGAEGTQLPEDEETTPEGTTPEESSETPSEATPEESSAIEDASSDNAPSTDAPAEDTATDDPSDPSAPSDTTTPESPAADSSEESSDGIGTLGIVLIAVLGVAVVAVVAVVIVKKKK